ncbi:unnamed protein product, partial [Coccothraustes coccothraustes]
SCAGLGFLGVNYLCVARPPALDWPLWETLIYYSKNKPQLTKIKTRAKNQCPKINP